MADIPIIPNPLPYGDRLESRDVRAVDLVVIHCTELPDLAMAREYGERIVHAGSGTGNSGHYYVGRDGRIERYVADERIAHHCFGCNARSIGIELVNLGRYPHWADSRHQRFAEPYPEPQVAALLGLLEQLRRQLPALRWIAGHAELDRRLEPASDDPAILLPRRLDPGPLFPWERIVPVCGLARLAA